MIENLQDELHQLENKQATGAKLRANITYCALGYHGINPHSKTPPHLSCQAPLKSENCPSPPF